MRHAKQHLRWSARVGLVFAAAVVSGSLGCGLAPGILFNLSSLGGDIPGGRANLKVKFVNQTPYVPVCTFGTYDPLNDNRDPKLAFPIKFDQLVFDDTNGGIRMDAFSESAVITWTAQSFGDPGGCGRAISLGGEQFILRLEDEQGPLDNANLGAMRPLCNTVTNKPTYGIAFYQETSAGPAADACESKDEIVAYSNPVQIPQGQPVVNLGGTTYYPCDGTTTVVITFVEDSAQPGGIRVDVSLEPEATTP
jgi:hypothetical protein